MVQDGLVSDVFSYNMPIDCFCKANVMNEAGKAFKVMQRGDAARSMKPLLDMQKHGKSLDILSAFLVGVSIFCCNLGKADEDGSQTGTGIAGGNFDVSEHLQAEQNNAYNTANQILLGLGFMFAEPALLLLYYDVCNLWLEVSCFQRDISQLRCSEGGDKRYFSLA
ncbi:hypothetical protein D5086_020139 [Populus alba]|uniref:Uncharacterized protein n=1 Tax=Populus alba TaxID=43335 RepID=A0ACC4BJU4_POPAL